MVFWWFWVSQPLVMMVFRWLATIAPTMEWLHTIVEVYFSFNVVFFICIHTEMCNFSKFYNHFGGQRIHLNFSKALQEKHWNWSFLSSTGKLVTWKDPQKWGWDQNWNRSHFDLNSHLHCKVLGVSRDICSRLETELFEKVSVRSIKQKEGALYFGHVQGENYTSALWLLLPEKTASRKHLDFLCWKDNITTLPWSQLW